MAVSQVTVIGANGQTLSISIGTSSSAAVAQQLLGNITAGLNSGAYLGVQDGVLPAIPAGVAGVVFDASNDGNAAPLQLPTDYLGFVNTSTLPITVNGNGGFVGPVSIFGGTGGFTYSTGNGVAGPGTGTISAGTNTVTGNTFNIVATTVAGGGYFISLGDGTNTINAAAGTDTINGGAGTNLINVGTTIAGGASSNDLIGLMGTSDTVTASGGSGKDTIGVNPAASGSTTLISFASAWTGSLYFGNTSTVFGSAGADTVNGGGGTVTLFGGLASTNFTGGTLGNNYIVDGEDHLSTVAGGGKSSVTGAGNGDKLFASSIGGGVIQAGIGNETLIGAGHGTAGYDKSVSYPTSAASVSGTVFYGNSLGGAAKIYVGTGADTVVAEGNMTVDGNAGKGGTDYYFSAAYTSVGGGAHVTINDFTVGADTVALKGYTGSTASIAAASTISGGNTSISLSDGTTVTFNHVTTIFTDPSSKFTFG